ncbi:hypothetical protein AAG570_013786 [Ranatra chinensis]|uniref:FAM69 protein-kinase domain-containing protein n=1 Tax=Ranatra chinensis TaxID=642074 RepID=A0ABD0YDC7_9HEMI
MSCHAWHAGKDAVFTVRLIADRPRTVGGGRGLDEFLVIKSAQQAEPNDIFHWIDHSGEHYPTELEFQRMIRHRVSSRLNVTLSESDSRRLSVFVSGRKAADDTEERHAEMREIWRLLQDNEYLLSMVYSDREIFPKLLGSCGQYFAVEYLHPIMDGEVAKIISKGDSDWPGRIHLAVMVLELVEEIDSQGLLLCDVKPSHFGLSGLGRVKFLDLDVAVPKQIADSITSDGRSCNDDTDCYLFDCRSTCNKAERICDSPVATTNIQIVCEKVLLGWSMVTRVMLPGLLMTRRTTLGLASLLRQCAQPDTDPDAAAHSHQRLANTLLEMDNAMAKDRKNLV